MKVYLEDGKTMELRPVYIGSFPSQTLKEFILRKDGVVLERKIVQVLVKTTKPGKKS